jgi:hypothetical protein
MKKTQLQLPDELYNALKRLASAKEWSLAEAVRRGAEQILIMYPHYEQGHTSNSPPKPLKLGKFKSDHSRWRDLANLTED